ncbi:MAG: efflux RND transporter periplasmic adaptor subunit [Pseudomonadota bacterium]
MQAVIKSRWRLALIGLLIFATFGWVVATQGPLAPIKVTITTPDTGTLTTSVFGIGTVEARRSYVLGPTTPSRIAEVLVDVGDRVQAGQLLAQMEAVDLDQRVESARLAAERAEHAIRAAQASLAESKSRHKLAQADLLRYEQMRKDGHVSEQDILNKRHEVNATGAAVDASFANLQAARHDRERALSDADGVRKLREQLRLTSPVDGIVTARHAEPGTTMVAGQPIIEVIDPTSLWVSARIDQRQAGSIRVDQRAEVILRSAPNSPQPARVTRLDWVSDPVTEERSVNLSFSQTPGSVPVGELVEVTIWTEEIENARWIPAAARRRVEQQDGVWVLNDESITFRVMRFGVSTLDGRVQIIDGLLQNEQVVVHTQQALTEGANIKVVSSLISPTQ